MKTTKLALAGVAAAIVSGSACADDGAQAIGKIKICRSPGIIELMDRKPVPIPAKDTYTGKCDANGGNCRFTVEIALVETAIMPANMKACITAPAKLIQSDGKPLPVGMKLAFQGVISGFTPTVTVAQEFK